LKSRADGSPISVSGNVVGSKLIGQSFTDKDGNPLPQYFQSRPSAAGAATTDRLQRSNLGPESIVDTLPDRRQGRHRNPEPADAGCAHAACDRQASTGSTAHARSARRTCRRRAGRVLSGPGYQAPSPAWSASPSGTSPPFIATYKGVKVELAKFGEDYSTGQIVPIRGNAPA